MRILQGTDKIAEYQGKDLVLCWDELMRYKGKLKMLESSESFAGKFLLSISLFFSLFWIISEILFGRNPLYSLVVYTSVNSLLFWITLGGVVYSLYLKRNKDLFDHHWRNISISDLKSEYKNVKKLDIVEVLEKDLIELIDSSYFRQTNTYSRDLILRILRHKTTEKIMERLNLGKEFILEIENKEFDRFENIAPNLFLGAFNHAFTMSSNRVGIEHFCLHILFDENLLKKELIRYGVGEVDLKGIYIWLKNKSDKDRYRRLWEKRSVLKPKNNVNRSYTSVYSPTIEEYTSDYTLEAVNGKFEIATGRDQDINLLIVSLVNSRGAALLLMGKNGVGKSKILRHLAVRMVVEDVPEELKDRRLMVFDFQKVYANIDSADKLRSIIYKIFDEASKTKDVVLVMNDLDNLLSLKNNLSVELINTITSSVSKNNLKVIVTITEESYTRYIQPNNVLASSFYGMIVHEPAAEVVQQILMDSVENLEQKYKVNIQFDAIKRIVSLSKKVLFDKAMPSSSLQILEDVCVAAQVQGVISIGSEFVSNYLSQKVGVKVGDVSLEESKKLLKIEEHMHARVIGQDTAINILANALRRARAGLDSSSKPVASFLFYGPTGVGKTEVAKTLAETYFGDEQSMVRLDMSEYQESTNLERLLGGEFDGEFRGGYLTEPVRTNPFSLILLDELEKANPKVLDLFLHILDEGSIKDGIGRKIDFSSSIIIATSNIGSKTIAEMLENGKVYEEVYEATQIELRKEYRIEFLNRFDGIIMFKPLNQKEIKEIVKLALRKIRSNMKSRGIEFKVTEEFVSEIAEISYSPVFGAREINRVIQDRVQNTIANLVLSGELVSGREVHFLSLDDYEIK